MLVNKVNEFKEVTNDVMDMTKKVIGSELIDCYDDDQSEELVKLIGKVYKMVDLSMEIITEQAKMMDNMNDKINYLYEKSNKD